MLRWIGLVVVVVGWNPGSGSTPADDTRMRAYERIVGDHDAAVAAATRAHQAAKTRDEERAVRWPDRKECAAPLLALAEQDPGDEPARLAASWIVEHGVEFHEADRYVAIARRAGDILLRHKDDPAVGFTLLEAATASSPSPPRDHLLRALYDETTLPANKGRACLALAEYLKAKAEFVQKVQTPGYPTRDPFLNSWYGAAYMASLAQVDPAPLRAESERLFERVLAEYATLDHLPSPRFPDRVRTLGDRASDGLANLHHVAVGQPAPEIGGDDLAGQPLRLSDHRGKVVTLVFWGTWCGSCMAQVPHEKALNDRMRGRPFALLGVNSDEDRANARSVAEREGMAWRSWFDGGKVGGPIARDWNIPHWPVVVVIDHQGVIRARDASDPNFLDHLVDDLVAQAERAGSTAGSVPVK